MVAINTAYRYLSKWVTATRHTSSDDENHCTVKMFTELLKTKMKLTTTIHPHGLLQAPL